MNIKKLKRLLDMIKKTQEKVNNEYDKVSTEINLHESKRLLKSKILSTFEWELDSFSAKICCEDNDCYEALKPYLYKSPGGDAMLLDTNITLREHDGDISISYYPVEEDYKKCSSDDITMLERNALIKFINKYKLSVVFSDLNNRIKTEESTITKIKELIQYYTNGIK